MIHFTLTSSFVGQEFSEVFLQILWFLRCQISTANSAISILYRWLSPGFGFPAFILKLARAHLVRLPMLFILGQVLGFFFSHTSLTSHHICFCPATLQESIICSRLSIELSSHWLHTDLCSQFGIFSQYSPTLCALCNIFHRNVQKVLGKSLFSRFSHSMVGHQRHPQLHIM